MYTSGKIRQKAMLCGIFRELDLNMTNHFGSVILFIGLYYFKFLYFAIAHKFASHLYPHKGVGVRWCRFQVAFLSGATPLDLHLAVPIIRLVPDHCQQEL